MHEKTSILHRPLEIMVINFINTHSHGILFILTLSFQSWNFYKNGEKKKKKKKNIDLNGGVTKWRIIMSTLHILWGNKKKLLQTGVY